VARPILLRPKDMLRMWRLANTWTRTANSLGLRGQQSRKFVKAGVLRDFYSNVDRW